jgi:hypothetical protein
MIVVQAQLATYPLAERSIENCMVAISDLSVLERSIGRLSGPD